MIYFNNGQKYVSWLSKKCHILINTITFLGNIDGCKITTIVSLGCVMIGLGFALIPASEAETSHQIESFEHFDAKMENNIEISV